VTGKNETARCIRVFHGMQVVSAIIFFVRVVVMTSLRAYPRGLNGMLTIAIAR
jgi:hypothetical protein